MRHHHVGKSKWLTITLIFISAFTSFSLRFGSLYRFGASTKKRFCGAAYWWRRTAILGHQLPRIAYKTFSTHEIICARVPSSDPVGRGAHIRRTDMVDSVCVLVCFLFELSVR